MTPSLRRLAVGGALAAAGLVALIAARCATRPRGTAGAEPEEVVPTPSTHACAPGLSPLVDDACYAAPAGATGALPLVLYLHGYFDEGPGEGQREALDQQRRVAERGIARGFAVLALRGTEGACATSQVNATKVCWPSNEKVAYKGARFVRQWQPALDAAAARHPLGRRYVFGFSNGGFFAGLIAVRALYEADAFAVAHAGPVEPVKALGGRPPLLLLSADDDSSQEGMVRLDDELTRIEWPHEHYVRAGGHALPDSDIEVALTFFERTTRDKLPLRPPLGTRTPRAREPHDEPTDAAEERSPAAPEPEDVEPEAGPL